MDVVQPWPATRPHNTDSARRSWGNTRTTPLLTPWVPSVDPVHERTSHSLVPRDNRACDLAARLEGRAGCAYAGGATGAHAEQGRAPSLCASRSKVGGASPRPTSVVTVQRAAQGRSALLDDTHNPRARPGIGAQSSNSARARLAATCRKPLIWKTQPPSRRDKA